MTLPEPEAPTTTTPRQPFALWLWIIAIAILNDKNVPGLFPRWFGYMTI